MNLDIFFLFFAWNRKTKLLLQVYRTDDFLAFSNSGFMVGADVMEFVYGSALLQENHAVEHLAHFLRSAV